MKKRTVLYLLAMSCLTFQACNNNKKTTDDSVQNAENVNETKEEQGTGAEDDDSKFAVKAASGGLLEVALGKLAQEKGQSAQVKEFGAQMVKDHEKANEELKALATLKNITIPTTPGEDQQKDMDEISKLSGAEFDKKYISYMKDDHEEDVSEFKKAAQDAKDPSIKEFAAKTLPTLQMHLDMVTAIDKKLN
ncbi:DUF4142 domain-containing protein [uncultured Fibrella sp.]|uniref:DUF4142 domain-containing protein n=1 Tax=uncultured Fibrella sp. TaxID=1284596 RepID=UPI0035C9E2FB